MAMNLPSGGGSGDPEVVVEMNTTPLIDVMLVLLVMLIITIPIQTHAVKLDMPTANPSISNVKPEVVDIDVDFDGTVLWNGHVLPDRDTLENNFRLISVQPNQPEVHVKPNKLATYKYVAMVMASAQRLGISKIGIVGSEQFSE